ncbi:hypothetical protein DFH27DRAFT_20531 [Peziza echinospora]|nr:hypothetical protein DFH27DRAFT_20531 [Peziza echinospora]
MLSGQALGKIIARGVQYHHGVLKEHNDELKKLHQEQFLMPTDDEGDKQEVSRVEWVAFSVNENRIGRNYFAWAEMSVKQPVHLAPVNRVLKAGRATGVTFGTVSGAVVLSWEDGRLSSEIAVVGSGMAFADNGDSGALCVVEMLDGDLHAGGMVIGNCWRYRIAAVMPMWRLIRDVERELGERVIFR